MATRNNRRWAMGTAEQLRKQRRPPPSPPKTNRNHKGTPVKNVVIDQLNGSNPFNASSLQARKFLQRSVQQAPRTQPPSIKNEPQATH
eukprot:m.201756 g.201756  ORF g.201756 m.201756 type:complete len:88 (-) comp18425_c0_seq10:211-474(-)